MKELASFRLQVLSTIDKDLVEDIASYSILINILRKLQDRLYPIIEDRAVQAVKRYRNLIKAGSIEDVCR